MMTHEIEEISDVLKIVGHVYGGGGKYIWIWTDFNYIKVYPQPKRNATPMRSLIKKLKESRF